MRRVTDLPHRVRVEENVWIALREGISLAARLWVPEGAEVGVGCAVGSKCVLKKGAELAPCGAMGHLAEIGERTRVSFMSWVGAASRVGPDLSLPPLTIVPNRARVPDAAALEALFTSTLGALPALARRLETVGGAAPPPAAPETTVPSGEHPGYNAFE